MTREEAKKIFINRGYIEVEGGIIYDGEKWRESVRVISDWLEQLPTLEPQTPKINLIIDDLLKEFEEANERNDTVPFVMVEDGNIFIAESYDALIGMEIFARKLKKKLGIKEDKE